MLRPHYPSMFQMKPLWKALAIPGGGFSFGALHRVVCLDRQTAEQAVVDPGRSGGAQQISSAELFTSCRQLSLLPKGLRRLKMLLQYGKRFLRVLARCIFLLRSFLVFGNVLLVVVNHVLREHPF